MAHRTKKKKFFFQWAVDLNSEVKVAQSCMTLCDPMDCSLPGSSLHGILQARMLEWVAIPFSRGCSQPRDQTQVTDISSKTYRWTKNAQQC